MGSIFSKPKAPSLPPPPPLPEPVVETAPPVAAKESTETERGRIGAISRAVSAYNEPSLGDLAPTKDDKDKKKSTRMKVSAYE